MDKYRLKFIEVETDKIEESLLYGNETAWDNFGNIVLMIRFNKELIKALKEVTEQTANKMDSLDALRYSLLRTSLENEPEQLINFANSIDDVKENIKALRAIDEYYWNEFGTEDFDFELGKKKTLNVWSLTKEWLQTDNDTFFKRYGFNYVPPIKVQEKAKNFLWSENKWLKAERELENGISGMKTKSCGSLDLNLQKEADLVGLIKKMGKTTFSSLNSNQQTNNRTR